MPINLYLKKCPIEEGKVDKNKFLKWAKQTQTEKVENLILEGKNYQKSKCVCSLAMKCKGGLTGVALFTLESKEAREPRTKTDYRCMCPVWDSNLEYLDEIRKYFEPFREDESDV